MLIANLMCLLICKVIMMISVAYMQFEYHCDANYNMFFD